MATTAVAFDPARAWRKARSVALRPEPFGALVYHFGNRKLSFLKSKTLVAVVEALADQPSAAAALTACGVTEAQRPAYVQALADLARSQMIEERTSVPPTMEGPRPPHPSHAQGGPRDGATAGPCTEADNA
jgi:mycofactocin biosynthesis protein MftB